MLMVGCSSNKLSD